GGEGGGVNRLTREHVSVAGLSVEQRQYLIEITCGRLLRRRLPVVVERERILLVDRMLDRGAGVAELRQHRLRQRQRRADARGGRAVAVERGELRAERQGDTRLGAEPGIGLRRLPGAKLQAQLAQPMAHGALRRGGCGVDLAWCSD